MAAGDNGGNAMVRTGEFGFGGDADNGLVGVREGQEGDGNGRLVKWG